MVFVYVYLVSLPVVETVMQERKGKDKYANNYATINERKIFEQRYGKDNRANTSPFYAKNIVFVPVVSITTFS